MNKTHFKKLKNTNYVGSWDLAKPDGTFGEMVVTIKNVTKEMVFDGQGGKEDCPVCYFNECKPMVMNSTNLKAVAKITGSSFVEDWVDKQICLHVQQVKAFGGIHDALRIKVALKPQKQPLAQDRFEKAIESVKAGTYTKEKLKSDFALSAEQIKTLNETEVGK
jgi:hypothetical protein